MEDPKLPNTPQFLVDMAHYVRHHTGVQATYAQKAMHEAIDLTGLDPATPEEVMALLTQ